MPHLYKTSSSEVAKAIIFEAQVRKHVLQYFTRRGFIEVHSKPMLHHSSTEKHLYPFTTRAENLRGEEIEKYFLRFSPEMEIKKMLACNIEKIVELGWVFRNREDAGSPWHASQFCMLEWYHCDIELKLFIAQLQHMLLTVAKKITGKNYFLLEGKKIMLSKKYWQVLTVAQAFARFANIDFSTFKHWDELILLAKKAGATDESASNFDDAFYWFMVSLIEPQLKQLGAVVLWQYPAPAAAFAALNSGQVKKKLREPLTLHYGDRFECYIAGVELANGYKELTNASEQEERMQENIHWLTKNKVQHAGIDKNLLAAIAKMPPCCGVAMGFERLVMLLLGHNSLQQAFLHRYL